MGDDSGGEEEGGNGREESGVNHGVPIGTDANEFPDFDSPASPSPSPGGNLSPGSRVFLPAVL